MKHAFHTTIQRSLSASLTDLEVTKAIVLESLRFAYISVVVINLQVFIHLLPYRF
jgi:hypothetical protein